MKPSQCRSTAVRPRDHNFPLELLYGRHNPRSYVREHVPSIGTPTSLTSGNPSSVKCTIVCVSTLKGVESIYPCLALFTKWNL